MTPAAGLPDLAVASASLSWDQWLTYLEARGESRLALPRGLDLANPGDLRWLEDSVAALDRSGPSLPL